jgi:hypothetical protein
MKDEAFPVGIVVVLKDLNAIGETYKVKRDLSEKVVATGRDPGVTNEWTILESDRVVMEIIDDTVDEFWRNWGPN